MRGNKRRRWIKKTLFGVIRVIRRRMGYRMARGKRRRMR
jgi:hypothetical protein